MTTFENSLYSDLNAGGVLGGVLASIPALWQIALDPAAESHGSTLFLSTCVGALLGHTLHSVVTASNRGSHGSQ